MDTTCSVDFNEENSCFAICFNELYLISARNHEKFFGQHEVNVAKVCKTMCFTVDSSTIPDRHIKDMILHFYE